MSQDFTVRLEQVFQGPMDLLLHLVREQEVDIHEIEIGTILGRYMEYLQALETIDIEIASEFVVMAANLMAAKSRSLLPQGEEIDLEAELDPRDELIQRLLEYRQFKGAAGDLADRFDLRSRLHGRGYRQRIESDEEPTLDLSEITQWDILATFSRLMRETLADRSMKIEADSRPLRAYVEDLVLALRARPMTSLRTVVEEAVERGEASKPYMVGTFCALLELVKVGAALVSQERNSDDIVVSLREDIEGDLEGLVHGMGFDDEMRNLGGLDPESSSDEDFSAELAAELELEPGAGAVAGAGAGAGAVEREGEGEGEGERASATSAEPPPASPEA